MRRFFVLNNIYTVYTVCMYLLQVVVMIKATTKMFTAKVDEDLLKSFKYACENQDTTASQAVRAFMRDYVRKHSQADLFKKPKG